MAEDALRLTSRRHRRDLFEIHLKARQRADCEPQQASMQISAESAALTNRDSCSEVRLAVERLKP